MVSWLAIYQAKAETFQLSVDPSLQSHGVDIPKRNSVPPVVTQFASELPSRHDNSIFWKKQQIHLF